MPENKHSEPKEDTTDNILEVTKEARYATVEELFKRSKASTVYYTLLILSAFIIAPGLILNNAPIVIGGMLVTPMLTPILVIGLGFAVGEISAIKNAAILVAKSLAIVIGASFLMGLLFGTPGEVVLTNTVTTAVLYFIVAAASGVAATLAWVHKEVGDILPGVSIAVSLVPPLSLVGIWLSALNAEGIDNSRFFFLVFLFNLIGIVVGSLVVFSLLKFHKATGKVHEKAEEVEEENEAAREKKEMKKTVKKVRKAVEKAKAEAEAKEAAEETIPEMGTAQDPPPKTKPPAAPPARPAA